MKDETNKTSQTEKIEIIKPKHEDKLVALEFASLGFSIVIAIVVGVGLGLVMKNITGATWTLWVGVVWGIAAAILNIKKAYDKAQKQFKELADDPRYSYMKKYGYKDDDDI
ncbi:MAG: hypothetical protein DRG11_05610 [Epsilonproteobacteria bacterium]|nr:MAG: hypothetical protein DRG11_05610 [Campylobacterota bacterium]